MITGSKYRKLKSCILYFAVICIIYGACTQVNSNESPYSFNFTINGDSTQPNILLGTLSRADSNLCYKASIGIPINIESDLKNEITQWSINRVSYSGQKIEFQPESPGIVEVILLKKDSIKVCKKYIYIRPAENQVVRSNIRRNMPNFNCNSLQFSNNRFYGTILGLPDGRYQVIVLENRQIKTYRTISRNREAIFNFDTAYSNRPEVILRSVTNSLNNGINCIFLANPSL